MRIGPLRHRVTIQVKTSTQDSYNEPIPSWSAGTTVWARVAQQAGEEAFNAAADQEVATVMYNVTLRYRSDIILSPYTHRLVWGTKVLDILAVRDPDGRNAAVVCMCRERVGETTT